VLMLTRAIPGIALSLPIFMLWVWTGLLDTHIGVIIVYLAMNVPFTVWLTAAPALLPPRSQRLWLGVNVIGALLLNSLILTHW